MLLLTGYAWEFQNNALWDTLEHALLILAHFIICHVGVPFVCAATVRSVAHTSALTVVSRSHAPGEHPKLEKVIEQRLSNFLVHVLIGMIQTSLQHESKIWNLI